MAIIVDLLDYINNNLSPYSSLTIDTFQASNEEIIIRHEPSTVKETVYLDKTRIGMFNFSILAKSLDASKAVQQLDNLIEQLNLFGGIDLNPFVWVKVEPVTSVRFISKTDKNESIYSVNFTLEYRR